MITFQFVQIVSGVIDIYCLIIIVWCVLSFFPQVDSRHPLVQAMEKIVAPVLNPLRRMLPPMGGMDFSPLLALFLLRTIQQLLVMLLSGMSF